MFSLCFPKAIIAASCWGHFDGSKPCPTPKDPSKPTDDEKQAIWRWNCKDQITDYLLDQHISKKIALDIMAFKTTKECWDYIKKRFLAKSEHAKADLYQAFIDMKCPKNSDVWELCCVPRDQSQGKGKKGQMDKALATTTSKRGNNRNGKKRCNGKCHHCGKEGYWIWECCTKKKQEAATTAVGAANLSRSAVQANTGNSSKPENRPVGSANVTTIDDTNDGDFWAANAEIVNMYDDPMMGKLESSDEEEHNPHAKLEGKGEDVYWLDPERIAWDIEEMAGTTIMPTEVDNLPCAKLYDSGILRCISPYKADFTLFTPLSPPLYINATNQHKFPAIGTGTLVVQVLKNRGESTLVLHNALYAPSVCYMLVSIGTLDRVKGYTFCISEGCPQIITLHSEHVGNVMCTLCNLYKVECSLKSAYTAKEMSAMELHYHLGHISIAAAYKLVKSGATCRIKLDPNVPEVDTDCEACIIAHTTHLPMLKPHISAPAQSFGDKVHTNMWGPSKTPTKGSCHYFITFTDNTTHFTLVYLLSKKSKALKAYKFFEAWAITQQHSTKIKVLHSDCRGEYLSKEFDKHLAAAGMAQRLMTHNTLQLNGIAEQLNWMLLEHIQALGYTSGLPQTLWGKGLHHATWLKNQTAMHMLDGRMPFKALYRTTPNLLEARPWGCKVWVHDNTGSKLGVHAHKG